MKRRYSIPLLIMVLVMIQLISKSDSNPEAQSTPTEPTISDLHQKIMTYVNGPGPEDSQEGNRKYYQNENFELGRASLIKITNSKEFTLEIQNANFSLNDVEAASSLSCSEPNAIGVQRCTALDGPFKDMLVVGKYENGGTVHVESPNFPSGIR